MQFIDTVLDYGYQRRVESIHLQEGSPPLFYQAGSHSGWRSDVRAHLPAQIPGKIGEIGMWVRTCHMGDVLQRLVPLAIGYGQVGAFCVYTSEARDRSQSSYLGHTCKLSFEDSLAGLVETGLVSTEDALSASLRPDILLEILGNR